MDVFPSWYYLAHRSLRQEFDALENDVADAEVFIDYLLLQKAVLTVYAGTGQDLKGPRKAVLVYIRRTVKPEIDVNIKPGAVIQSDWRIAKAPLDILLSCQLRFSMQPANDLPGADSRFREIYFSESVGGYLREFVLQIIALSPISFDELAEFVKYFH